MFEPPVYEHHFFEPNYDSEPVFVVGLGRSGTTMLRLMLHGHPSIAMLSETWFGPRVWERRWAFPMYSSVEPFQSRLLNVFIGLLQKHSDFPIDFEEYRNRVAAARPSLSQLLTQLGELWREASGKPRWGEKTPVHIRYVDVLARMYPNLAVLHIIRDPRDVAASLSQAEFAECGDAVSFALEWIENLELEERLAGLDPNLNDRILRVRYEDLVVEPSHTLRSICRHIGEDFEPEMLAFHKFADLAQDANWMNGVAQPLNRSSVGRWRRDLNGREAALIEAACDKRMMDLGYACEQLEQLPNEIPQIVARLLTAQEEKRREQDRPWRDHVRMGRGDYRSLLRTVGEGWR